MPRAVVSRLAMNVVQILPQLMNIVHPIASAEGNPVSQLNTFVAPSPNFGLIRLMTLVNRVVMLKGVVGLRDLAPFDRLAGLRGLANVRCMDFPQGDQERLRRVTRPTGVCFVAPNHPEFFTDWMIDKEIASRFFPKAAFWATNTVVNGLGRLAQKFWLANNLIAQIPGNSAPAREHSITWATAGNVVLLHPEGQVGWHRDLVAPLMPGAAEMALEVVRRQDVSGDTKDVWLAPLVWKLTFMSDVEPALARECAYVERKLRIKPAVESSLAERVYTIYATLQARDELTLGLVSSPAEPFARRHERLVETLSALIAKATGPDAAADRTTLLKVARKQLREGNVADATRLKRHVEMLTKALRIGSFAWARPTVTQEELAEHIKRLRADHCVGSWRDTLNRMLPQPAGPRRAYVRVPEPINVRDFAGKTPAQVMAELRRRMQAALDEIVEKRAAGVYANPFRGEGGSRR